jgi:NAD(P)-dependent dehydrogenase (short-subunit alcohol dehydrogenase family)
MDNEPLDQGWILVTGAARRIGRAIALHLAEAGYDIIIHYHSAADAARQLAADIEALDRQACLAEIDLANATSASALIPALTAELGPLCALVNNASLFERDETDPDGARHHAVNVEAPRLLSEAFAAQSSTPPSCCIVNLLDSAAMTPNFAAYSRSKTALRHMTLDLARRLAPAIRVNGLSLGPTLPAPRQSAAHFETLMHATPLRCAASLQDIAAAALFLIETPSITGAIIPVDGGAHLRQPLES